jgi:hypothetical protein
MAADKTADAIKLNLRLPPALHKRLRQQAKRNNVSLNTEIVNQLEGSEVAMVRRMADALKPVLNEALEFAVDNTVAQNLIEKFKPHDEADLEALLQRAIPAPTEREAKVMDEVRRQFRELSAARKSGKARAK